MHCLSIVDQSVKPADAIVVPLHSIHVVPLLLGCYREDQSVMNLDGPRRKAQALVGHLKGPSQRKPPSLECINQ